MRGRFFLQKFAKHFGMFRTSLTWCSTLVFSILFAMLTFVANEMSLPQDCKGDIQLEELWESAYSYGKRGMFDEARLCFEHYASREPAQNRSWSLLSEIHARMGNGPGAVRHAAVAARISGHERSGAEAFFLLANGHMAMNRFDLARQFYYRFPRNIRARERMHRARAMK